MRRTGIVVVALVGALVWIGCESDSGGNGTPLTDTVADTATGDGTGADVAPDSGPGDTQGADAVSCTTDAECEAALAGTLGACETTTCDTGAGTCVVASVADGTACDDGDECTTGEACTAGTCAGGTEVPGCVCEPQCDGKACGDDGCGGQCGTCDDGDACTDDSCELGQCVFAPRTCEDDGNPCTIEACDAGTGECAAAPKDCDDANACTEDSCDVGSGECVHTAIADCVCDPTCEGKDCGPDGCGGSCGECGEGESCSDSGQCGACVPDCAGKSCGPDGCGGSCGECGADETCGAAGQCTVVDTEGSVCAEPFVVDAVPFDTAGDTSTATHAFSVSGAGCGTLDGPWGEASTDHVYAFTAPETGVYTVTLDAEYDSMLYVRTSCDDATSCVAGDDYIGTGTPEQIVVPVDAGATVYIVVDGWNNDANEAGPYGLSIGEPCIPSCDGKECGGDGCGGSCGECAEGMGCDGATCVSLADLPGNTCENALPLGSAPVEVSGDTSVGSADFGFAAESCPGTPYAKGDGSRDLVYSFTPDQTAVYTFDLQAEFDSVLYVATACGAVDAETCLGAHDSGGGETVAALLEAGATYFVYVDGYSTSSDHSGPFTLSVGEPCVPACEGKECGGDGCGGTCGECAEGFTCDPEGTGTCLDNSLIPGNVCTNPFVVDAVPYTFEGDTSTATNDYAFASGACSGFTSQFGQDGADQVFAFTPEVGGVYTITQSYDGGYDNVLAITTACPGGAEACLAADYTYTDPDELSVELEAGVTYFVVSEHWSGTESGGTYTLQISEPCTPTCDQVSCGGDNGCGGTCGCADEQFCSDGACADLTSVDGNTCLNPLVVSAVPFEDSRDTSVAADALSFSDNVCPGASSGKGDAGRDIVYRFAPPTSGVYTASVDSEFDAAVYVATNCLNIDGTCLGGKDSGNPEEVSFTGESGSVYYIVVDGWSNTSDHSGPYTLTIGEPCLPSCDGLECGDDGCGGTCGECAEGDVCTDGACGPCVPQCDGAACGPDGCGGSCGECGSNEACVQGACLVADSCAGRCGTFDSAFFCNCDELCVEFGDCCADFCANCADVNPTYCGP